MSGVAIIRNILANNGPVVSAVSDRVFAGVAPMSTSFPAISIRQISGREQQSIKRAGTQTVTERIQVSILASSYRSQKQVMDLVRSAITCGRINVSIFSVDSIIQDSDGPDLYYEDPITYEQSIDFIVRYYR